VAKAELNSLRELTRHDKKELASFKERARADGCKIHELEEKKKYIDRKFEADK